MPIRCSRIQGLPRSRAGILALCMLGAACGGEASAGPGSDAIGCAAGAAACGAGAAGGASGAPAAPSGQAGAGSGSPAVSGTAGIAGTSGLGPSAGNASIGSGTAGGGTAAGARAVAGSPSAGAGAAGSGGTSAANGGASGASGAGGTSTPGSAGTSAGQAARCGDIDPLEVMRGLAPIDEDLAGDYADYLADELGKLTCATEGRAGARTITDPIFVPPNAVYDGRGETLSADVAAMRCDTSEGEQAEHQRPFFVLAPGAQLKNVTITYPGCEGVHMMGDNVLEHITWQDAGEDAASVRSYFPGGKITIRDSEGHKAADKMFQFNAPCDVRIERFTGSDMGKLVRQNGGTEFELHVDLNTVNVTGVISAVVQSDSPKCFIKHHALSYQFTGSGDKSDRVFRDVPPGNITAY